MQPRSARHCPKCSGEVCDGWRVCPNCAAPLAGEAETATVFAPAASSSSVEEGRFPAGTVLAGRYRIVGLIGRGGMGEVYRAYDLILNQAVALKFVSQVKMNEPALVRFRNEVRIARQVSHPNVCRVYDIGVIEGLHFLSMEYLDGEDLDSLIRRIGHLPQDKAIEFARKICAGLAAAHERGVLHRDLKPANIMIDGRGQVRITDFGLAALAAEIPLSDLRSGTPAYMSPEQKAGKEVTTRSDLYSLGLVLYEMFTGKRRSNTQTNPTDLVKDLDPDVERVILRCLEEDSRRRPSSALNVAMGLPGGDPVAAALAAGETPSPEMVAASGEKEGFNPRTAAACFLGIVISLIAGAVFAGRTTFLSRNRIDIPPEALAFHAQGILKQLGYTDPPRTTAYGFLCCNLNYFREPGHKLFLEGQPAVVFWYRQHRYTFTSDFFPDGAIAGDIDFNSPANIEPGMIRLALDTNGRLLVLEVRPTAPASATAPVHDLDWTALLTAAGLDPARLQPAVPQRIPPTPFDARMAWTGTGQESRTGKSPAETIRVEAASWQGLPVFLDIGGDAQEAVTTSAPRLDSVTFTFISLFVLLCVGSTVVARRNLRLGRADRRGAARVAAVVFSMAMGVWVFTAGHAPNAWEFGLLVMGLSWAAFEAAVVWLVYIAVEPYVRRNWPDSLISWTRVQTGRLQNPLVASHILAGILFMEVYVHVGEPLVRLLISAPPALPDFIGAFNSISSLNSAAYMSGVLCNIVVIAIYNTLAYLLLVVLLRLLVRRLWVADTLGAMLAGLVAFGTFGASSYQNVAAAIAFGALGGYGYLWLIRRFGLLALLATWLTFYTVKAVPLSLTSWYTGRSILGQLIPVAVATWALWVILSAQRRPASDTTA